MSKHRGIGVAVAVVGVVLLGLGWGSLASAISKPPAVPGIEDVQGVWTVTASHVVYDLNGAVQEDVKAKGTYTITDNDNVTVNVHFEGDGESWDDTFIYAGGVFLMGAANDDELADFAQVDAIVLSGKPGHLSGKGQFIAYDTNDESLVVGTISIKQTTQVMMMW